MQEIRSTTPSRIPSQSHLASSWLCTLLTIFRIPIQPRTHNTIILKHSHTTAEYFTPLTMGTEPSQPTTLGVLPEDCIHEILKVSYKLLFTKSTTGLLPGSSVMYKYVVIDCIATNYGCRQYHLPTDELDCVLVPRRVASCSLRTSLQDLARALQRNQTLEAASDRQRVCVLQGGIASLHHVQVFYLIATSTGIFHWTRTPTSKPYISSARRLINMSATCLRILWQLQNLG